MSFDPAKPAANTPAASAEMRAQLAALNTVIQTRATLAAVSNAITGTLSQTSSSTSCQ